jgi:predicted negative regulator of RcsB-dependent stress response
MPQYKNLPRVRKVNKADEFVSAIDHILAWLKPHWQKGAVLLALLGVLGIGYLIFQHGREAGFADLSKQAYEATLKPQDQREQAYRQIIQNNPSQPQSALLALRLAQLLSEAGKFDESGKVLQEYEPHAPSSFRSLFQTAKAQLEWQQGHAEEGMKLASKVADDEKNILASYNSLAKAEMLEGNKKDEAIKIYEEIALGSEDPLTQKMAQARLVYLKLKGK